MGGYIVYGHTSPHRYPYIVRIYLVAIPIGMWFCAPHGCGNPTLFEQVRFPMGPSGSMHSAFPMGNSYHGIYVKGLFPIGLHNVSTHGVCQSHHIFVMYPPMGVAL